MKNVSKVSDVIFPSSQTGIAILMKHEEVVADRIRHITNQIVCKVGSNKLTLCGFKKNLSPDFVLNNGASICLYL